MSLPALILAAGRGERMRPLTDHTPKPLLPVRGKPLLQWHMEALARGGFTRLVLNTAWLGPQIEAHFGRQPLPHGLEALQISYSREGADFAGRDGPEDFGALETLGGMARALPLLGEAFWVLAGDVFAPDFVFSAAAVQRFLASGRLAHLWLVPNPPHHPRGDFGLAAPDAQGLRQALNLPRPAASPTPPADPGAPALYTYSTIGLYRAALLAPPLCDIAPGNPGGVKAPLAPLLRAAMDRGLVSAELYTGPWTDVGTPERLAQLNRSA